MYLYIECIHIILLYKYEPQDCIYETELINNFYNGLATIINFLLSVANNFLINQIDKFKTKSINFIT